MADRSIFTNQFFQDPYPEYRRLRDEQPLYSFKLWGGNCWMVTRHADAMGVLLSPDFRPYDLPEIMASRSTLLEDGVNIGERVRNAYNSWLFFQNPPRHTQLKQGLSKLYSPARVERLSSGVRAYVDAKITAAHSRANEIAIVDEILYELPIVFTKELLGLDQNRTSDLVNISKQIFELFEPLRPAQTLYQVDGAFSKFHELQENASFDQIARKCLGWDGRSANAVFPDAADPESHPLLAMLFGAGYDTIVCSVTNAINALSEKNVSWDQLTIDGELTDRATKEVLRYDVAVQFIARIASRDTEVCGKTIRAGDRVDIVLGSANRDDRAFLEPDHLNFGRDPGKSMLAFGAGAHFCLGYAMAVMVTREIISSLYRHFGNQISVRSSKRRKSFTMRGFDELTVAAREPSVGT